MNSLWYHFTGLVLYCLALSPVALFQYGTIRRLTGAPFRKEQLVQCVLLMVCSWCCNRLVLLYLNGWNVAFAILWYAVILLAVFRVKGWSFAVALLKLMLMLLCLELGCALLVMLAGQLGLDTEMFIVAELAHMHDPHRLLGAGLINALAAMLIWLAVLVWQHLFYLHRTAPPTLRKRRWHITFSVLRLTVIVGAAVSLLAMPHYLFGAKSLKDLLLPNQNGYILLAASVTALVAVALSYLFQDINYLVQSQRLNTLEQQQNISRGLMQNLRFFRHNTINMLYGLEGALLSDDREKIETYFAEIKEKCALINNENILALERVTNPPINALLLRAIDRARVLNLPINLYVQENISLSHAIGDADLCQLVGVLLDNALEAANEAAERYVLLELRNVDGALELIVSNTYSGTITTEQLSRGGTSTKEGHAGQGLLSCYSILSRTKNACLNFWVSGQYVRAQLLLHR